MLTAIRCAIADPIRYPSPIFASGALAAGGTDAVPSSSVEPSVAELGNGLSAMAALLLADEGSDERQGGVQVESDQMQRQVALQNQMQEIERETHDTGGRGFFGCIGKLLDDVTGDVSHLRFDKLFGDGFSDVSACDNPKFWSDLEVGAKAVAAIAAAAATVCTAGAAGPLVAGVAVALSAAGWAVQQTGCLGGASGWVGGGLTLGAAVVSCGGTLLASTAATAGALAQTASSTASAASLAQTAGTAATASAGAEVVSGAAHIEVTGYQADALEAQAGAQQAKQSASFFAQMQEWALDSLAEQVQSHRGAMAALAEAMQANQRGALATAGAMSRG